jgi:hypothetical protein
MPACTRAYLYTWCIYGCTLAYQTQSRKNTGRSVFPGMPGWTYPLHVCLCVAFVFRRSAHPRIAIRPGEALCVLRSVGRVTKVDIAHVECRHASIRRSCRSRQTHVMELEEASANFVLMRQRLLEKGMWFSRVSKNRSKVAKQMKRTRISENIVGASALVPFCFGGGGGGVCLSFCLFCDVGT